jgi:hypothetical protein
LRWRAGRGARGAGRGVLSARGFWAQVAVDTQLPGGAVVALNSTLFSDEAVGAALPAALVPETSVFERETLLWLRLVAGGQASRARVALVASSPPLALTLRAAAGGLDTRALRAAIAELVWPGGGARTPPPSPY